MSAEFSRDHHAMRELNGHMCSRDHEMQNDICEGTVSVGNPNVKGIWMIPNVKYGGDMRGHSNLAQLVLPHGRTGCGFACLRESISTLVDQLHQEHLLTGKPEE